MTALRGKLGRAVRRLRRDAGYSQDSFADKCKLHRTYMGSVERGETNISLDKLERIAKAMKRTAGQLLREAEKGRCARFASWLVAMFFTRADFFFRGQVLWGVGGEGGLREGLGRCAPRRSSTGGPISSRGGQSDSRQGTRCSPG